MTNEEKNIFVCRISQANRTQLIVIMQEILLCYIKDAKEDFQKKDMEAFHKSIANARNCIMELRRSLDLSNEIAKSIYPIYNFCDKFLIQSDIKQNEEGLDVVKDRISRLRDSFLRVSEMDSSKPLMENTQTVYAGMTYGRHSLNENIFDTLQQKRGYLV